MITKLDDGSLPAGADPTEWGQLRSWEIEEHRNLYCSLYRKCLDYAAGLHWESWSCRWCPLFEERKE